MSRSLLTSLALLVLVTTGCEPPPLAPPPATPPSSPPAAGQVAPAGSAPGYGMQHLDKDGDGHVSLDEYKAALKRKFEELDRDRSGTIHVEKECSPLFVTFCRKADRDNDGHISQQEFLDHAEQQFREADKNGDGKLHHEELPNTPILGWRSPWN